MSQIVLRCPIAAVLLTAATALAQPKDASPVPIKGPGPLPQKTDVRRSADVAAIARTPLTTEDVAARVKQDYYVAALAVSPDGKLLVSTHDASAWPLNVWRAGNPQARTVKIHENCSVTRLQFSPSSASLAGLQGLRLSDTADKTKNWVYWSTITIWDTKSFTSRDLMPPLTIDVRDMCWLPDERFLAVVSAGGHIEIWNVPDRKLVAGVRLAGPPPSAVAVAPDGKLLATGFRNGVIRLHKIPEADKLAAAGEKLIEIPVGKAVAGHEKTVTHLLFSPDGSRLVSGSVPERNICVWDVAEGKPLYAIEGGLSVFTPDGKWLITTGGSGDATNCVMWDVATGAPVTRFAGKGALITHPQIMPDGKHVVLGSMDGTVRFFTVETAKLAETAVVTPSAPAAPATPPAAPATVRPEPAAPSADRSTADGSRLGEPGESHPGEYGGLPELKVTPLATVSTDVEDFKIVELSPDGKVLATASGPARSLELWEAASGKALGSLTIAEGSIARAAFNLDGKTLVLGDSLGFVSVFDVDGRQRRANFKVASQGLTATGVSPDGKLAFVGTEGHGPAIWDIATGKRVGADIAQQGSTTAFAVAPRSGIIAAASDGGLLQFLDATGKVTRSKPVGQARATALRFSHGGAALAMGTNVALWIGDVGPMSMTKIDGRDGNCAMAFVAGKKSLVAMATPKINLWSQETQKRTSVVRIHTAPSVGRLGSLSLDGSIAAMPISPLKVRIYEIPFAKP